MDRFLLLLTCVDCLEVEEQSFYSLIRSRRRMYIPQGSGKYFHPRYASQVVQLCSKYLNAGRLLSSQKTENQTGFPFIVLKHASSAVCSDGSFLFPAYTRKNVLFADSTSPLPRFLASQDKGRHQTWRAYVPLS